MRETFKLKYMFRVERDIPMRIVNYLIKQRKCRLACLACLDVVLHVYIVIDVNVLTHPTTCVIP